jgi:plastocyanin
MRKLTAGLVTAFAALSFAAPSLAATRTVQITRNGFTPATITIDNGDTVVWRNADTVNHQVVADNGTFASPILRANQSFSFTFRASGTYRYRDSLYPSRRGTITVRGAPPSVAIAASAPIVFHGGQIHITGQISSKRQGETVRLLAKPYPQASFAEAAEVVTDAAGMFDFLATPEILTSYQATWSGASSIVATVEVKPRVLIQYNRFSRVFTARVTGGVSYAGKSVYLQRLNAFDQWVSVKKVRLNLSGQKQFRATLPKGRNRVRIFLTVNQAGPGYLASWSGTWTLIRR